MKELEDFDELYLLPKNFEGYSDVAGTSVANGLRYKAQWVDKDIKDWFLSSMKSLLEHVENEMPEKKEGAQYESGILYQEAYNHGVRNCIDKIKEIKESL